MLSGDFQGLVYAFSDGDAGHHDDELGPAIALIQLENGLDVAVGLARAGFHLHIEVDFASGTGNQFVGKRQVLPSLDGMDIFDELDFSQLHIGVFEALSLIEVGLVGARACFLASSWSMR